MKVAVFIALLLAFIAVASAALGPNYSDPPIYPEEFESDAMNGGAAAAWALAQVGKKYSQTSRDGPNSYDCSSLVYYAWKAAGKNIGAATTRQYPGRTYIVGDLQAGDLLWKTGHVGMYVGNNQVVNAENPKNGIKLRDLAWYKAHIGYTIIYRPK
jgi:cell wall-associated NlpC family hydrolase